MCKTTWTPNRWRMRFLKDFNQCYPCQGFAKSVCAQILHVVIHFHPCRCYSFLLPHGILSFVKYCFTKLNHYGWVSSNLVTWESLSKSCKNDGNKCSLRYLIFFVSWRRSSKRSENLWMNSKMNYNQRLLITPRWLNLVRKQSKRKRFSSHYVKK